MTRPLSATTSPVDKRCAGSTAAAPTTDTLPLSSSRIRLSVADTNLPSSTPPDSAGLNDPCSSCESLYWSNTSTFKAISLYSVPITTPSSPSAHAITRSISGAPGHRARATAAVASLRRFSRFEYLCRG